MLDHFTAGNQVYFDNWRLNGTPGRVVIHQLVETGCPYPGCGWDEFTQSGKLTGCPACGGAGKLFTDKLTVLRARVVWGATNFSFAPPSPGVELGDVTLGIATADLGIIQEILAEQRSFLVVDGQTVRPTVISPSVIPDVGEGYFVSCNLFTNSAT